MKELNITFTKERETKNTVRFTEVTPSDTDAPKVGTIYVSKSALKELDWDENKTLGIKLMVC